jgi:hypothetical protein
MLADSGSDAVAPPGRNITIPSVSNRPNTMKAVEGFERRAFEMKLFIAVLICER